MGSLFLAFENGKTSWSSVYAYGLDEYDTKVVYLIMQIIRVSKFLVLCPIVLLLGCGLTDPVLSPVPPSPEEGTPTSLITAEPRAFQSGRRRQPAQEVVGSSEEEQKQMSATKFYPIWSLMNAQQKQEFLAGYLQGWRDAAGVTDVAIAYVKENPSEAAQGLQSLRNLYDMSGLKPDILVEFVDRFYSNPANQDSPLSRAVSAAR